MSKISYVNGHFIPNHMAKISVNDRTFHFSDAVYEVIPVFNSQLIFWKEHISRLKKSLKYLDIKFNVDQKVLQLKCKELIEKNDMVEGIVYLHISRGIATRNHAWSNFLKPSLVISAISKSIFNLNQKPISIITDEDIRSQGFRSIGDIARYTPGVNTSQGEGHRDAIVFRGVRSTADFYMDGIRDDVQYYRSLYNLEQVAILRGPNALLFGRGGTGGIVNRVTKKGQIGEEFGSIDLGFDTFGAYDFSFDFNTPLSDNMALRVNAHNDYLENHRDHIYILLQKSELNLYIEISSQVLQLLLQLIFFEHHIAIY